MYKYKDHRVRKRNGGNMQVTRNVIKFNGLNIKIPEDTKRVWDLSENRWGYKYDKIMPQR